MQRLFALALAVALSATLVPDPSNSADLRSVKVTEHASLPRVQPSWRMPNDKNQVFFLQRSNNANTVVYTANFDGAGNLNRKAPANVYWRRFAGGGEVKPLKRVERQFAYGVNTRKRSDGNYRLTLKPAPQLPMILRQTGSGKAELWANIGGRSVVATYGYLEVDESGLLPKVTALTLFGRDPRTGGYVSERFSVSGGTVRQ